MERTWLRVACSLFIAVTMMTIAACTDESAPVFDTSGNIYKDEYAPRQVQVRTADSSLRLNHWGTIEHIFMPDSTEMIGKVDKIQVADGNVYIMDKELAKAIFCYDLNGKLKWKYGGTKLNEKKFAQLSDMHVRGDAVFALDGRALKIIQLDTAGRLVRAMPINKKKKLWPDDLFVESNQNIILYNFDIGDYADFPYEMTVMDADCRRILSYHLIKSHNPPAKRWGPDISPIQYFRDNSGFYFTKAMNDTIYSYRDGIFSRAYTVDFGKHKIPDEVKSRRRFSLNAFQGTSYEGNIERIVDNDSVLFFMFSKGNQPGYAFVDKQTLQTKSVRMVLFNIDKYFQMLVPVGSWDGNIVASLLPVHVLEYWKHYKQQHKSLSDEQVHAKMQAESPMLYKLMTSLTMRSNPVLVSLNMSKSKLFPDEKK